MRSSEGAGVVAALVPRCASLIGNARMCLGPNPVRCALCEGAKTPARSRQLIRPSLTTSEGANEGIKPTVSDRRSAGLRIGFGTGVFEQWVAQMGGAQMADSAQSEAGQTVIDVVCGTGVLTREIESRAGPTGRVVGLDPSPGMLAVARGAAPGVDWRECAAENLPFRDAAFDAVLRPFGRMFFRDQKRATGELLREAETALSPYRTADGAVVFDVTAHLVTAQKD